MLPGIRSTKCLKTRLLMKELRGIWHMSKTVHADRSVAKSWKKLKKESYYE